MDFNVGDIVKFNGKGYIDGLSHFEKDRNKEYTVINILPEEPEYDMIIEVTGEWGWMDSQYGTGNYWMVKKTVFDLVERIVLGGE